MATWSAQIWAIGMAGCLACAAGCKPPPYAPVPGPEASTLLPRLKGYVVIVHPLGRMTAASLPGLKETVVLPGATERDEGYTLVGSASGPDREGRIVYFAYQSGSSQGELRWVNLLTGEGQPVTAGPANDSSDRSESLALSERGGRVARIRDPQSKHQMYDPQALLTEGVLEIREISGTAPVRELPGVLDGGLHWFPDGRHLAYAALIPRSQVDAAPAAAGMFGAFWARWDRAPAVHILDTHTGTSRYLHGGTPGAVSADGEWMLVSDYAGNRRRVRVADGVSSAADLPGNLGFVALPGDDLALFWSARTAGVEPRHPRLHSPVGGRPEFLSIKVGDLGTGEFKTLITYVDRRLDVCYGIGPSPRDPE